MGKVSLCSSCSCCPAVEVTDREVRIGEEGNMVRLTCQEWNTLVEKVMAGELKAV